MTVDFLEGDVLAYTWAGRQRYIRIGRGEPDIPAIYVQDCDGAGFLLGGHGRYLKPATLASRRYRLHHRNTR